MAKVRDVPERVETSMRSSLQPGDAEDGVGDEPARLLVLDEAPAGGSEIKAPLEARGYQVIAVGSVGEALPVLRRLRPALAVLDLGAAGGASAVTNRRLAELRADARELGIPLLDVVDAGNVRGGRIGPSDEADDWVVRGSSPEELAARVARLLRRRGANPLAHAGRAASASAPPIDTRFSALIVHDLRTPLNVIGLSIRMLEQALPRDDPEVAEDLRFIDANLHQIERMLTQLADYARLFEPELRLSVSEFDPRRLVDDLLENRAAGPGGKRTPVHLDLQTTCPTVAALDQGRARMAIDYALNNATEAAHDVPIRLTLRGGPQRWVIEAGVDRPPPSSVSSVELRPQSFERLCGSAAERRGMELAIAARVSELFGGTARLEAAEGRGTTIVLDWPARIADHPATA